MTAEVRKLAKGSHSTLLLNSLMTVWELISSPCVFVRGDDVFFVSQDTSAVT